MLANGIEIISPLEPAEVLENLRTRGKEWRESSVPEDLRKLKVWPLIVTVSDMKFDLRWPGSISPLYNPVCFGTLEPTADGTRIMAGFGRDLRGFIPMFLMMALASIDVAIRPRPVPMIVLGVFLVILLSMAVSNRNTDRLRARLIEVIAAAAQPQVAPRPAAFTPISGNGP